MEVTKISSIPLVRLSMRVDEVRPAERGTVRLTEVGKDGMGLREERFVAYVPKKYSDRVVSPMTVEIVCIPSKDMTTALEVFALFIHKANGSGEWLFAKGSATEELLRP